MISFILSSIVYSILLPFSFNMPHALDRAFPITQLIPILALSTILFGIIGIFIGSFIQQLGLRLVGGKEDYEATFRILSTLTPLSIISTIPILNFIVGVYHIILNVIGVSKVHKISLLRSFIAVFVFPIALMILAIILIFSLTLIFTIIY